MKLVSILTLALCLSGTALAKPTKAGRNPASANAACEEKAKAIVKAVHAAQWPGDEASEPDLGEASSKKKGMHTYNVEVGSPGNKFGMNYRIVMEESGEACYMRTLATLQD